MDQAGHILSNNKLVLPTDVVAATDFKNDADAQTVSVESLPRDRIGLDIGPDTISQFKEIIAGAKTIIWNGPMGAFEMTDYAEGTIAIAKAIAASPAQSIVGGGDSLAAAKQAGVYWTIRLYLNWRGLQCLNISQVSHSQVF